MTTEMPSLAARPSLSSHLKIKKCPSKTRNKQEMNKAHSRNTKILKVPNFQNVRLNLFLLVVLTAKKKIFTEYGYTANPVRYPHGTIQMPSSTLHI